MDIPPAYYANKHSLISAIKSAMTNWRPLYGRKQSSFLLDHFDITYDKINKQTQVMLDAKVIKGVVFSKTLQYLLG